MGDTKQNKAHKQVSSHFKQQTRKNLAFWTKILNNSQSRFLLWFQRVAVLYLFHHKKAAAFFLRCRVITSYFIYS